MGIVWNELGLTQEPWRLVRSESQVTGAHFRQPEELMVDVIDEVVVQSVALSEIEIYLSVWNTPVINEGSDDLFKDVRKYVHVPGKPHIHGRDELPRRVVEIYLAFRADVLSPSFRQGVTNRGY